MCKKETLLQYIQIMNSCKIKIESSITCQETRLIVLDNKDPLAHSRSHDCAAQPQSPRNAPFGRSPQRKCPHSPRRVRRARTAQREVGLQCVMSLPEWQATLGVDQLLPESEVKVHLRKTHQFQKIPSNSENKLAHGQVLQQWSCSLADVCRFL